MTDTSAEASVAYLLDKPVSNGRDPAEAVLLVHRAANSWSEARAYQSSHGNLEVTQEG